MTDRYSCVYAYWIIFSHWYRHGTTAGAQMCVSASAVTCDASSSSSSASTIHYAVYDMAEISSPPLRYTHMHDTYDYNHIYAHDGMAWYGMMMFHFDAMQFVWLRAIAIQCGFIPRWALHRYSMPILFLFPHLSQQCNALWHCIRQYAHIILTFRSFNGAAIGLDGGGGGFASRQIRNSLCTNGI